MSILAAKTALADTIKAAAPLAVVFDWWALGAEPKQWPGALRSALDLDAKRQPRTHGYVIEFEDAPDGVEVSRDRVERRWAFKIFALHYHEIGKVNANSSVLFLPELEAIQNAFDHRSTLPSAIARVTAYRYRHDLRLFGTEQCHFLVARLEIEPNIGC